MQETVSIPFDGLVAAVAAVFEKAGCAADEARTVAERLAKANITGHDSHGVLRVPRYVSWMASDELRPGVRAEIVSDNGPLVQLEGNWGFGQLLGEQAVRIGLERARTHGISAISLRHSGHLGRIGEWAELAAADGFVSVHFVNVVGSRLVAPFGAAERRFSTAPFCVGVPNGGTDDVILDFATSAVAEGKVHSAAKGGKPLPAGVLVTADGALTDNPEALYGYVAPGAQPNHDGGTGALNTFGEHKGSGLALACELLAGALSGGGGSGPQKEGEKFSNSMLSFFVSPDALQSDRGFAAIVSDYVDWVRGARPRDAANPVLVPGDPERAVRAERLANGVPLPREIWQAIVMSGEDLGLERGALERLAGIAHS